MRSAGGSSVRLRLTLSYAGFLMLAGALLLGAVWLFLLRYVPDRALLVDATTDRPGVFPIRSNLLHVFAPRAAVVLAFLLVEQQLARESDAWRRRVFLELPVVGEQLAILLSAGYSLGAALNRLSTRSTASCLKRRR